MAEPLRLAAARADVNGQGLFASGASIAVRAQATMLAAGVHRQHDVILCQYIPDGSRHWHRF